MIEILIYWAPLLHFYQPPTQLHWVLKKVCEEAYRPLIGVFQSLPHAKVTVNINGVLTEMLHEHGQNDIIEGLRALAERGQLEFTGSGKYHPILPLIPLDEMRRQIAQNHETNRRFLGKAYAPRGFFPPELAYSEEILQPIAEAGYGWIILGGIACPTEWPRRFICEAAARNGKNRTLAVFFRDDILSNKISFQSIDGQGFLAELTAMASPEGDAYVITAMDAETFGHHIPNWEQLFLAEVYRALQPSPQPGIEADEEIGALTKRQAASLMASNVEQNQVQVVTLSELLTRFPRGSVVQPRPSSWSTTPQDLDAGVPYPLWKDKGNEVHELQWAHLSVAIDLVRKASRSADNPEAKRYAETSRGLLDSALHSCQFWWASRRPMWDLNMINRGLAQQQEAVLNAYKAISLSDISEQHKTEYYHRVLAAVEHANQIRTRLLSN